MAPLPRPVALAGAAAALVLALGALAGCSEPAPVASKSRHLHFGLSEYRISPQRVSVPAGRITITADDNGILSHNLRIVREVVQRDGTHVEEEVEGTDTLQPGESDSFTVTLKPGTYKLACTLSNHENLGQYGELIVKEP